ncbi:MULTISPECIES: universal stress protein [Microbacterium]|uniref:universal stress protein n=1 Tax=Microbacterium TaxID=33882 RepID=UPI00146E130C|nr:MULTISPECIES: universal stress protein [Microbacterium]
MPEQQSEPVPAPTPGKSFPWTQPGILVGIDSSESSRAALRYAAEIAPKLGLPLHGLVVWDYPALAWGDAWYYPESYDELEKDAEQVVRAEAERAFPEGVPDWFTGAARRGSAAAELIDASRDNAMLVVGSRGHGGFAGLLLGSVSRACAAHGHCPVLIVHEWPLRARTASEHVDEAETR